MRKAQEDALGDELRLLMPDLPGFDRSRREEANIDQRVDACAARLQGRAGQAVVSGISYGGWVAALLAARYPELVAGLALSGVRLHVPRSLARLQVAASVPCSRAGSSSDSVAADLLQIEKKHLIEASRELGEIDLPPALPRITAPTVVFAPS